MPIDYRGAYPYWYYKRVELADRGVSLGAQYLTWNIKSGYNYWVRGLLISYPHYEHIAQPYDVTEPLYISLIQVERNRTLTEIPIPTELLSNPGQNQPPPPGSPQHSRPLYNGFIRFNYLISNKDVLHLKIQGHNNGLPEYCRICIVGHNVKEGYHV